jgi:hypothetical protein
MTNNEYRTKNNEITGAEAQAAAASAPGGAATSGTANDIQCRLTRHGGAAIINSCVRARIFSRENPTATGDLCKNRRALAISENI